MLLVITICAVLTIILLWIFLSAILKTLAGIGYTLTTIREAMERSQMSLENIEEANKVFEDAD
jgi:hypothetical protein